MITRVKDSPLTTPQASYRGRFAPSPTGPLHFGSLIGALASYLDAKANGGLWLVRVDDIDPPREVAGASEHILQTLRDHGLRWDEDVLWQSSRHNAYENALEGLLRKQKAFYCQCSRTQLAASNGLHNGLCINQQDRKKPSLPGQHAIRALVADAVIEFDDAIQGRVIQDIPKQAGDFVLRRKDGFCAYQLATVVDDAFQGITHVVRGSDLLDSTARQIYLQNILKLPSPDYCHFPVITNQKNQKLSKQTHAPALNPASAYHNLLLALGVLQQESPPVFRETSVEQLLSWAIQHWNRKRIPRHMSVTQNDASTP